jgi:biotin operon repressor
MSNALTERQTQIKTLLDEHKTPREIGAVLEISENAVYQHIRRMRDGGHHLNTTPGKRGRKPKGPLVPVAPASTKATTELSREQLTPAAPAARAKPSRGPRRASIANSPLAAVRARRAEIATEIDAVDAVVAQARAAYERAQAQATEVHERHRTEIRQLDSAETALLGEPLDALSSHANNNGPEIEIEAPDPDLSDERAA